MTTFLMERGRKCLDVEDRLAYQTHIVWVRAKGQVYKEGVTLHLSSTLGL